MLVHSVRKRQTREGAAYSVLTGWLASAVSVLFCGTTSLLSRRQNRWKKRGLAIIPTTYGLGFGHSTLDQVGALVHVYTDGTVLLSQGKMAIGQVSVCVCVFVCVSFSLPKT